MRSSIKQLVSLYSFIWSNKWSSIQWTLIIFIDKLRYIYLDKHKVTINFNFLLFSIANFPEGICDIENIESNNVYSSIQFFVVSLILLSCDEVLLLL